RQQAQDGFNRTWVQSITLPARPAEKRGGVEVEGRNAAHPGSVTTAQGGDASLKGREASLKANRAPTHRRKLPPRCRPTSPPGTPAAPSRWPNCWYARHGGGWKFYVPGSGASSGHEDVQHGSFGHNRITSGGTEAATRCPAPAR